ncbi:MAG TPA: transglycosylase domain-containing protein [Allosphingosinicella sp.]|nr:transglycosylase domain-containing protein [Allosphingosinicella sp.]
MLVEEGRLAAQPDPIGPTYAIPIDAEAPPRPRPRRRWRIAAALLALFMALFAYLAVTAPLSKSLQPIAAPGLTLLSAEGRPIARRGAITDEPVDIADLPEHVPNAFLAIEDRRFYNHAGVDPWGILRAALRNAAAGEVREGGSTITQQLAKMAFLSSDRTAARKFRELILAFWLEAWLDKDEILSRYLSSAYFGDNVYGLRAASHHYFSRRPEDLTLGQAAMLAGLVKAPSRLAPTNDLKGARERAEIVLGAMVAAGVLTEAEADQTAPARLKLGPAKDLPTGTYFADWAFPEARAAAEVGYGEQTVQTTLEDGLQRLAVRAVSRAGLGRAQVALVAMRPDGRVVAMVGGKSYKASPFNRATQARRQPGSAFKLFVYLAALRSGMTPNTLVDDAPITVDDWSPENVDGRYRGPITLREAFAVSSNVAAVRLSEAVGRDNVIRAARDLGVSSELTGRPSLALGTSGVRLIEMVAAYAAVAGGNYPVRPRALPEVEQGWFETIRSRMRRFGERSTWPMLLELLWSSVHEGTGRAAALKVQSFGKTGTSQDNRDAVFIGFAGDVVTGVWIGNDDNSPLNGIQGGGLPARIWRDFMSAAVEQRSRRASAAPPRMPAPAPADDVPIDSGPMLSVPIEETGYEVGVDFGGETVTIAPEPPPPPADEEGPEPADVPTIAPPPPAPVEEEELLVEPED